MTDDERKALCSQIDLEEFAAEFTPLIPRQRGSKGVCPIHWGDDQCFVVDRLSQRWHCFGQCGTGGDAVRLLAQIKGISVEDAYTQLKNRRT